MRSPLKFLQEYDLTEEKKRQIIFSHFSWLVENQLAAMSYPGFSSSLGEESELFSIFLRPHSLMRLSITLDFSPNVFLLLALLPRLSIRRNRGLL
jgi:hypothetical protein